MTERAAGRLVLGGSLFVGVLGLFWPASLRIQFLHLATLLVFLIIFVSLRRATRPFGLAVRLSSAGLVLLPLVRGRLFIHQVWLSAVWFGLLEFGCATIRRRWMQQVRYRHAVKRLVGRTAEATRRLEEMKQQFDKVQEEITLYQTVYDLATGQTVGMTRADILNAAGQSLKELSRRRNLRLRSTYLCMVSGEDIDLRNPRLPAALEETVRPVKDRILKKFMSKPAPANQGDWVVQDGSWVGLAIRYQNRLLGGLCLELDGAPPAQKPSGELSAMDLKLLTVTADLMGLAIQNSLLYEQVNQMAITDRLTGLFVLWYFKDRLKEEVHRAMRSHRPLSVLMMDLDHFKSVNDTHGHLAGDAVLREITTRIKQALRDGDLVARYGGEEISAILPETLAEGAMRVAERIRASVEKNPVNIQSSMLRVTISIGVNDLSRTMIHEDPSLTSSRLLKGADEALYRAKHEGRNCVRTFVPEQAVAAGKV